MMAAETCSCRTLVFVRAVKPALEDVLVGIFWLSPLPRLDQIVALTSFEGVYK